MHLSEGPEATDRLVLKEAENKDGQAKMLGWDRAEGRDKETG